LLVKLVTMEINCFKLCQGDSLCRPPTSKGIDPICRALQQLAIEHHTRFVTDRPKARQPLHGQHVVQLVQPTLPSATGTWSASQSPAQ
jgi:hypothetical protein